MKGISRRNFIKGGIVAGGAAAFAGMVGCSQGGTSAKTESWLPEKWDYEADIVAIGAGAAGLSAGIEAGAQGLTCITLESQQIVGGNSAICNGGISIPGSPVQKEAGIDDSPDKMYKDLCAWFKHDYDEGYVRMLCDLNGSYLYEWLTSMGVEFKTAGLVQSNAHSVPREHHVNPGELINTLYDNARSQGADVQLNTRAMHLIQDPVTKRIVGVMAEKNGDTLYYKAKKAVMLCNGGYARNADMLNQHIFGEGAENYAKWTYDALGIDGSGILMGQEVGADTRHMSYLSMLTVQNPDGGLGDACAMYHQGAVMVNLEGARFVNEAQGYTNVWSQLEQQTDAVCYQVWDDAIAQACADNESSYYSMAKIKATGLLLEASTLDELAGKMGVPAGTFVSTVERYNSDVLSAGVDSAFGREHIAGTGAAPLALATAPFYAFKTMNVICCTYGGLKRCKEDHLQAADVFGNAIPSLYLAGSISDFCDQGCIPSTRIPINSSGTSFGGAMSFSRKCVQEIAKLGNWDEA